MEGRLQPIVDALIAHYQAEHLKGETQAAQQQPMNRNRNLQAAATPRSDGPAPN